MQIHVVQRGQTLSGIAQAYSTTWQKIATANQLPDPNQLVIGQALVIPIEGKYHWVQPGESLWSIAHLYNIDPRELARINGISYWGILMIGQRLYIPPGPKPAIEVNGYIESFEKVTEKQKQEVKNLASYLTYLAPFSFQANRDGTLTPPPLNDLPNIAKANGITNILVVTNQEKGQFSKELAHVILTDQEISNKLLQNIINTANQLGFKDVHFDFEFIDPADTQAYNRFLLKAKNVLKKSGFMLSTALAPKISKEQKGAWYTAHDYEAHGKIVDFVVLMTYEWGYTYSTPQPVSPIGPVTQVVNYALTEMPAKKILLGQNMYGYDWKEPFKYGGEAAKALSPQQAIELAKRENVAIKYDYKAQAPYFKYVDKDGQKHEVWFEDARSIQAKFDLIKIMGLRGISYWKLGLSFPQNWLLLQDNFKIIKRR
ncbi:spore gernimation protein [Vulcanibacillus modesticaldus]|uniref:Spore gernimation protein n=1 Tax=Vulcanibacillus modesticaldus TaxID=337097 RepID=A0A1D2YUQ0_9BACI|nr:glycoside hydrolase family 18 protein [Vulcanibacillus modesticaldus]OEF99438.1 spore gernimation protein [Vulcanibacillus modesticaldus]